MRVDPTVVDATRGGREDGAVRIDRNQIRSANDATYAAWNARDPDAVAAVFAADAELVDAAAVHRGEFLGIPATGRSIRVEGCTFSRFGPDGLVVRDVNFWDVPGLLAQLSG
jgi:hypothetical protein